MPDIWRSGAIAHPCLLGMPVPPGTLSKSNVAVAPNVVTLNHRIQHNRFIVLEFF